MQATATDIRDLKYEDFPIKLFFRLMEKGDAVAERVLGSKVKWGIFKKKWESDHTSLESDNQMEQQQKVNLAFVQAQKAALVIRWLSVTETDLKQQIIDWGYKWYDDPEKMVRYLLKIANKSQTKYELESANLEKKMNVEEEEPSEKFNIDEAIKSLDMLGFTITNNKKVTIGEYTAMSRVAEKRLKHMKNGQR